MSLIVLSFTLYVMLSDYPGSFLRDRKAISCEDVFSPTEPTAFTFETNNFLHQYWKPISRRREGEAMGPPTPNRPPSSSSRRIPVPPRGRRTSTPRHSPRRSPTRIPTPQAYSTTRSREYIFSSTTTLYSHSNHSSHQDVYHSSYQVQDVT